MSEMTYAEWQRERTTVMEEARVRADTIAALRADLAAKEVDIAGLRDDAERWRALLGSARLRALGWAGFDADSLGHADGYRHFGMEFWTHHDDAGRNDQGVRLLTAYADAIRVRAKEPPHAQ